MMPVDVETILLKDLDEVVNVHLEAFQGYLNTKLGRNYVRSFLRWFIEDNDAIALCARLDDRIAGYVVGAQVGYTSRLNRSLFFHALLGAITHFWVFMSPGYLRILLARLGLGRQSEDRQPKLSPDTMSLVGIGVHPSARGKAIGSRLIEAFEAEAVRQSMSNARLSVYPENAPAIRLYEKHGWQTSPDFITPSGAMYYYKSLDISNT